MKLVTKFSNSIYMELGLYNRRIRKVKIYHVQVDRENCYAYCVNTAIDFDLLPVSRVHLTVVESALYEWDVFEMAAPIQSPAKCEVPSVIRFLKAKCERPAEIHKHNVAVYGNVINRQNVTKWCWEFCEGRTDDDDELQEEVMTWFKSQAADFYGSGIQKVVPRLNKCLYSAGDKVEKQS